MTTTKSTCRHVPPVPTIRTANSSSATTAGISSDQATSGVIWRCGGKRSSGVVRFLLGNWPPSLYALSAEHVGGIRARFLEGQAESNVHLRVALFGRCSLPCCLGNMIRIRPRPVRSGQGGDHRSQDWTHHRHSDDRSALQRNGHSRNSFPLRPTVEYPRLHRVSTAVFSTACRIITRISNGETSNRVWVSLTSSITRPWSAPAVVVSLHASASAIPSSSAEIHPSNPTQACRSGRSTTQAAPAPIAFPWW